MITVHATTACLPGLPFEHALARLAQGVTEPLLGRLSIAHVQLCPQSYGQLTPERARALAAAYPATRLRLHATVRVLPAHPRLSLAAVRPDTGFYFRALAEVSAALAAPAYTLHAGPRGAARLTELPGKLATLEALFSRVSGAWSSTRAITMAGPISTARWRGRPGGGRCWSTSTPRR